MLLSASVAIISFNPSSVVIEAPQIEIPRVIETVYAEEIQPIPVPEPIPVPKYNFDLRADRIKYITDQSIENGVSVPLALYVAEHESRTCRDNLGDMFYIDGELVRARGCWQITQLFHPEVSDKCAFDIVCSTKVVMPWLKDKTKCKKEFTTCRAYYRK